MRIEIKNELLVLNLLVALLIAAILFFSSSTVLRVILGIPFLLFFPGYVLTAALFPKKEGIDGIERLTLSFGLSIIVVVIIGFFLSYTTWGIRLESIVYSITFLILVTSAIAWWRRRRLPEGERFRLGLHLRLSHWEIGTRDKVLYLILLLAVLGALGTIGYVTATPKAADKFTEFYLLGAKGGAADYPREIKINDGGRVTVGITNHEYATVSYRVEVRINGTRNAEVGPIVLLHNESREVEVSFVPKSAGENQTVEFLLYKGGDSSPSLKPLRLRINVAA